MKKLLLVILLTALTTNMFAGWSTNQRNKCRWYAKKFAANASVYDGLYSTSHNGDCDLAYAEKIKNCAWQKAARGWAGVGAQGAVYNWFCSRGEIINPLESLLLPKIKNSQKVPIEEFDFKSETAIFDEDSHSVIINGISGYIKLQKGNGFYSNIRLSIWQPNDDNVNFVEDEEMNDSEILNQFEIKVTDEGMFFNGNLVTEELQNQFKIKEIDNELYVQFSDINITIPIDSNILLDNLAVKFDGDGAPDTSGNIAKTSNVTNALLKSNEFKFITFPNPTSDILNIEFTNNVSNGKTIIEIFNSTGLKVKDVFNGDLLKEENKSINVNISNLKKDNYFILIQSNGKKLIKQIIKN